MPVAAIGDPLIDFITCQHAVTELHQTKKEDINRFKEKFSHGYNQGTFLQKYLARNDISIFEIARVDSGEYNNNVLTNRDFLGEFLEALIGAIYLDGGQTHADTVIKKILPITG